MTVTLKRHGERGELYTFVFPGGGKVEIDIMIASAWECAVVHQWFQETGSAGFRPVSREKFGLDLEKDVDMTSSEAGRVMALRPMSFVIG